MHTNFKFRKKHMRPTFNTNTYTNTNTKPRACHPHCATSASVGGWDEGGRRRRESSTSCAAIAHTCVVQETTAVVYSRPARSIDYYCCRERSRYGISNPSLESAVRRSTCTAAKRRIRQRVRRKETKQSIAEITQRILGAHRRPRIAEREALCCPQRHSGRQCSIRCAHGEKKTHRQLSFTTT